MEIQLRPEQQTQLAELARETGRSETQIVQEIMDGYLGELAEIRQTLDRRYDDIKSGRVKPIDGEVFFEELRRREEKLIGRPSSQ